MRNFRATPIRPDEEGSYFCCHCEALRDDITGIFNHLKMAHKDRSPQRHTDFVSGRDIFDRIAAEDAEADRFDAFVESLAGVDDFLLECGDA